MASSLLRKVWDSVANRQRSTSASLSNSHLPADTSAGAFDCIPTDILFQIVQLLGPKDAAKLGLVCRQFKYIVSHNRIWMIFLNNQRPEFSFDYVFFSEARLRSGFPVQSINSADLSYDSSFNEAPSPSLMRIYGLRAQVPGAIVVDGGAGYCKFGWSKYSYPSGRLATFLEFGNIATPLLSRLQNFFATVYTRMLVRPSTQPIVVSIPICHCDDTEAAKASRRRLKEAIFSALFDLKTPSICAVNQATLALLSARQTSGVVVNIGFYTTSVVPILHGKVLYEVGVEVVDLGALKLTGFLKEMMQQNNVDFQSLYTIRTLKENLCYVALDFGSELSKDDTDASFKVHDTWYTLSKERFKVGEILFQPHIAGVRAMGLHHAVALCMEHCDAFDLHSDGGAWFKTVVLAGGSACLPGLAERLEKELHGLLPPHMASGIRVFPPPYGVDSAWYGAKLIGNLSTFPGKWCITKKQFERKFSRQRMAW